MLKIRFFVLCYNCVPWYNHVYFYFFPPKLLQKASRAHFELSLRHPIEPKKKTIQSEQRERKREKEEREGVSHIKKERVTCNEGLLSQCMPSAWQHRAALCVIASIHRVSVSSASPPLPELLGQGISLRGSPASLVTE